MNKQEVIEKIEEEKSNSLAWEYSVRNCALDDALSIVRKLDEPEKPVVPKFVADWVDNSREYSFDFDEWFYLENQPKIVQLWLKSENKRQAKLNALALITLIVNGANAVEVEKEKLYTAKVKIAAEFSYLNKSVERGDYFMSNKSESIRFKTHFPQLELEDLGLWNNPVFEIEEVENDGD